MCEYLIFIHSILLCISLPCCQGIPLLEATTVYPKKYAHGFVVLCFVVVMQSFIMNSHEVFIHIHQSCFAGTGAIVRLPQCQWSKPDGYGEISQCIITTKHSKAKSVCIFLGVYCMPYTVVATFSIMVWLRLLGHGPLARYVKLWIAHTPGMPTMFPPPPNSNFSNQSLAWWHSSFIITIIWIRYHSHSVKDAIDLHTEYIHALSTPLS